MIRPPSKSPVASPTMLRPPAGGRTPLTRPGIAFEDNHLIDQNGEIEPAHQRCIGTFMTTCLERTLIGGSRYRPN